MSNEINIKVTSDALNKLVEEAVKKDLDVRLKNSYVVDNAIARVVSDELKKLEIKEKIIKSIEDMVRIPDSMFDLALKRQIDSWFTNNRHVVRDAVHGTASSLVRSKQMFDTYIEPVVSKAIAEDPSFIPYVKNEVSIRLNEKIKNVAKSIGDTITTSMVKEFLTQYVSNRFGDKQDEQSSQ